MGAIQLSSTKPSRRPRNENAPSELVDQHEVAHALTALDWAWESPPPREQARIVELLVERVDYDGASGNVSITFHSSGIKTLADELANQRKEKNA